MLLIFGFMFGIFKAVLMQKILDGLKKLLLSLFLFVISNIIF